MLKEFLKGSAVYGVATVFTRGIQLLLVPLYTRVLAPSEYASVDLMMVTAAISMSILTLEVASGMVRMLGDATDPAERRAYAGTAMWLTILVAAIVAVVALLGGALGNWVLGPGRETTFRVGALAIAGQLIFDLLIVKLRYEMRSRAYALLTVSFTLVSNVTAVLLVVVADVGVVGVFWGQVVGYAIVGTVAAVVADSGFTIRLDRAKAREMLAYSIPLVFSIVGGHVALLTDRIAIKSFLGLADVGVYAIGARVASTVLLVIMAFGSALVPLIYQRYRDPETPTQIARLFRVFLLMVLPMLLGLTLFSYEIVRILAPGAYAGAADVIALLSVAVVFNGMGIFAPGMELARRTRVLATLTVMTALLNVGLNILLVPRLGVVGSSLATLCSAACGFTAYLTASQRLYRVPHCWPRVFAAIVIASAGAAAGIAVARSGLALWPGIAAKGGLWLVTSAALIPVLLDRHDVGILRDRLRRSA